MKHKMLIMALGVFVGLGLVAGPAGAEGNDNKQDFCIPTPNGGFVLHENVPAPKVDDLPEGSQPAEYVQSLNKSLAYCPGVPGPAGADGKDGIDGTDGVDGTAGPQGPAGDAVVGPVGPAGRDGVDGLAGRAGVDGTTTVVQAPPVDTPATVPEAVVDMPSELPRTGAGTTLALVGLLALLAGASTFMVRRVLAARTTDEM